MKRTLVLVSLLALALSLAPVSAATPPPVPVGLAWDSVLKFIQGSDAANLQPGTFDADFQTASQPVAAPPSRGGILGRFSAAIDQAAAMASGFKTGMAERHYIAGNKERTDFPATQKATILDCGARTITSLDLKAKTYTVVSLDAPVKPVTGGTGGSRSGPETMPTDDGTRVAITTVNQALGPRTIAPENTDGYSSDMTIVTTRGNGQSASSEMKILEYVSKYPRMSLVCRAHGSTATAPAAAMAMAQYQMMQSAMYGTDQRFTITSSGPALPSKRLPLWEMMTTSAGQGSARGGGLSILTERGNVRSVRADDSIFSVPADFTLVQ